MRDRVKIIAFILALALSVPFLSCVSDSDPVETTAVTESASETTDETTAAEEEAPIVESGRQVEALDRGLVAVTTDDGILVSWRSLGTESNSTVYELYRDGELIYTSGEGMATCYLDVSGTDASVYKVITEWTDESDGITAYSSNSFDIPLDKPSGGKTPDGSSYTYSPGDCSCADLDGDGEYEIVVKWDPSNAQDNSNSGYTGSVIIDAYKLDGTKLWRIDLGVNIRAGAHYTQFLVYDFDGDGKAEMVCKTADGTVDGVGNVIGDADKDYRNSSGYILSGDEFLTVFSGETGAEITTIDYEPARGNVSDWGDNYGNRVDRFLACVAYLDGKTPSIVMCRGYYTRSVLVAYSFDGDNLTKLWTFDTDETGAEITTIDYEPARGNVSDWGDNYGNRVDRFLACVAYLDGKTPSIVMCRGYYTRSVLVAYSFDGDNLTKLWTFDTDEHTNATYAGQGNHNVVVADVDADGYDEIVYGQCCIDHDGTKLWNTRLGHGDAVHVGDFLPEREGLEVWGCLEGSTGAYLADAATGEILGQYTADRDVGRALADNFISGNSSAEFMCATTSVVYYYDSDKLSKMKKVTWSGGINFAVWFTGALERCGLDGTTVYSYELGEVLTGKKVTSINGTKSTPCLTADLLGDWREEIVFATTSGNSLRVYLTNYETEYRIYTLMHNTMYRCGVAAENVAYNIPPHTDYFLDSAYPLPDYPDVYTR
ncbi:MAG: rhamnogalacturonan lyase [Firmicutes bacterium]|nr:rhamnogalacturonan lyase [Bacillota bacterium]